MPYADHKDIRVPAETKELVRDAKDELGLTYPEFFEEAIQELTEETAAELESDTDD